MYAITSYGGFQKDTFYKNNLHKIEELKQKILATVIGISKETGCIYVKFSTLAADGNARCRCTY
jgi:hypothetical protein